MGQLVKNKAIDSLLKTMLFSAIVHVSILFPHSVINQQQSPINIFNILDLDLIFPGIELGNTSFVISYVFIIGVFGLFYRHTQNKERQLQSLQNNADQQLNNVLPFEKKAS